jgi:Xaa-Pro aminopeptidase
VTGGSDALALAERVSVRHRHAAMLEARRRARAAVLGVARRVVPGMSEAEGLELTRRMLRAHGLERDWVEPCLRFGVNTLKRDGEPSEPGVILGADDLWFVDVGPLWQDHESDYAETFVVGGDPERHRLVRDVRAVFDLASRHWRATRATGVELYRFAAETAQSLGWQLDPGVAGHRVGAYPHAQYHDGSLADAAFTPSAGLWMLEIQLRRPDLPYSAFFEDLLVDEADR